MPRTLLHGSRHIVAALLIMVTSVSSAEADSAPPAITCTVRAPASVRVGQTIPFTVTLQNRGPTKLAVLNWGTPFEEAWLQPFVSVTHNGKPVAYSGAMVKRGDPDFEEYFGLAPRERREASIDLALAFDFSAPGHYTIVSRMMLHDVASLPVALPRARAQHRSHRLACRTRSVIVVRL